MKRIGLLLLLGVGSATIWGRMYHKPHPDRRIELLLNRRWTWISWTEKTGNQQALERILPCMRDNVIRFEQVNGQNVYTEDSGRQDCAEPSAFRSRGSWNLSQDGQVLTITGRTATFEDSWYIAELTATHLKLAYRTTTSQGPFVMTMTFVQR
ncbi:lipocalin family protein [Hymenobacter metallicola]|uniref:Lipocalin-like domain-containing protein n=1 Tax=Hymenobacter metallicola TaxID=2563114 RepID=A0A4Z0QFU2_9BACT|nr:lipocalin family protein [Hymenobacter metallicola]TGE27582.1 hypothetical protein E5K02_14520 [Hymenobacter metallicola]